MVPLKFVLVVLLFCSAACWPVPEEPEDYEAEIELLRKILNENIVTFWYPEALDYELGGYRLNHGIRGEWKGQASKALVTQARTVWFFSRLVRAGLGTAKHLEAARHGYRFLADKLWDSEHGGFFWEVDSSGSRATKPDKHLYGQSFGLYALSEYGRASGDLGALHLARKLFHILEEKAHDSQFGGYREHFRRDWSLPPQSAIGYMNVDPSVKLMNTHLHLMEAITTYYEVTKDPLAKQRLLELILIQSNSVVRKQVGACTDKFFQNWMPKVGESFDRVSYGHDVENVWLLMDACDAAGLPNGPFRDLYSTLSGYSLQYGFDWMEGGYYDRGSFNQVADDRDKVWWVQAEGLVSTLKMYHLTKEARYRSAFLKTLAFVSKRMVDWKNGEWFAVVSEDNIPSGDKAGPWKSPYHNGRAIIECLELLAASAVTP